MYERNEYFYNYFTTSIAIRNQKILISVTIYYFKVYYKSSTLYGLAE